MPFRFPPETKNASEPKDPDASDTIDETLFLELSAEDFFYRPTAEHLIGRRGSARPADAGKLKPHPLGLHFCVDEVLDHLLNLCSACLPFRLWVNEEIYLDLFA
jgi:hypothetical protein